MRDDRPPRSILLATTSLYMGGGIACVSRCIARAIEEEAAAGRVEPLDTVSLFDEPEGPRASARGSHSFARGSQARFAYLVWRAVRRRDPDLVIFDHAGLARVSCLPLPGLPPRAYGIFAHGAELTVISGGWRKQAIEGSRFVLTNSEFTADFLRGHLPSLSSRVRTTPLCIDPQLVETWQRDLPAQREPRVPAVMIVGRIWAEERGKGHDALIAAMPRVRAAVPDAELWIVGRGDDVPRLEALVRERGLDGAVRFLGGVSDTELGRLYRRAGVYAMPSRQEGFGLVYAEAMWHGLPCIGSTLDAAGEVISDGETGVLVPYDAPGPLADAIIGLLSDRERAQRMGCAAAAEARRRFGYARFRADLLRAIGLEPSAA